MLANDACEDSNAEARDNATRALLKIIVWLLLKMKNERMGTPSFNACMHHHRTDIADHLDLAA